MSDHEVVAVEVSLISVGDDAVLPTLLNLLRRKIQQVSADGVYYTQACQPRTKEQRNIAQYSTSKQRGVLRGRAC